MLRTLACLLTLCVSTLALAEGLVGTWKINLDAVARDPKLAGLPPEQRARTVETITTMMAKLTFEARADGTASMTMMPGRTETGTWAAKGQGRYVLTFGGQAKEVALDGERFSISESGTTIHFERVKARPNAGAALPIKFGGKWRLDPAATLAVATPGQLDRITRTVKGLGDMTLHFKKGIIEMKLADKTETATFSIESTVDGVTTLQVKDGKSPKTEAMTLKLVDGRLHATANGETMVLRR